jgi:TRAP-type C4-dicarboxylate transport system permease small subunit
LKSMGSGTDKKVGRKAGVSKTLSKVLQQASKGLGSLSGLLSIGLVILISVDISLRALRLPMRGVLEISRLTLAWICFSSLVYTYVRREHVRVTIFTNLMGRRLKTIAEIISCLLGALLMFAIFYKSTPFFLDSWEVREVFNVDVPLPYWLAKLSVPVGSLVFTAVFTADLIYYLIQLFRIPKE